MGRTQGRRGLLSVLSTVCRLSTHPLMQRMRLLSTNGVLIGIAPRLLYIAAPIRLYGKAQGTSFIAVLMDRIARIPRFPYGKLASEASAAPCIVLTHQQSGAPRRIDDQLAGSIL